MACVLAVALAGCGGDDGGGGGVVAFCEEMERLEGERAEEYVGSSEHLDDLESLLAVAPARIRPDVRTYRNFIASGAVRPGDPDSNLMEDWPPDVRDAIGRVRAYEAQAC